MMIWFKRILLALVLLFVLAVAINFKYFYLNLSFVFLKQPAPLDQQFQTVVDGHKNVMEANYLLVPSLGIQTPVVYVTATSSQVFSDALQYGVVHYPDTALPGQPGNCFIFGHSSDYPWKKGSFKTVFALLPKIGMGEQILISDPTGAVFRYRVTKTQVVSANQVEFLDQSDYQSRVLTLQTSYPIGTALRRFIVTAELVR